MSMHIKRPNIELVKYMFKVLVPPTDLDQLCKDM